MFSVFVWNFECCYAITWHYVWSIPVSLNLLIHTHMCVHLISGSSDCVHWFMYEQNLCLHCGLDNWLHMKYYVCMHMMLIHWNFVCTSGACILITWQGNIHSIYLATLVVLILYLLDHTNTCLLPGSNCTCIGLCLHLNMHESTYVWFAICMSRLVSCMLVDLLMCM